jgi:hypothetical protein
MHSLPRTLESREVAIVSTNPETLDGLQSYLHDAGVAARGTRRIEDCPGIITSATIAVVIFPDDFSLERVRTELRVVRPSVLRVLVTSRPQTFEPILGSRRSVIVVPRPVWGWKILDAIRAHADVA